MSESALALLVTALALTGGVGALALRTLGMPGSSPDRLVAELRLAQVAALILAFTAGTSVGLVVGQDGRTGMALEVALGIGVFIVATVAPFRDPRVALTLVALGFTAHAVLGVLHRPGMLAAGLAPQWYYVGSATQSVLLGVLCYLPVLRR